MMLNQCDTCKHMYIKDNKRRCPAFEGDIPQEILSYPSSFPDEIMLEDEGFIPFKHDKPHPDQVDNSILYEDAFEDK